MAFPRCGNSSNTDKVSDDAKSAPRFMGKRYVLLVGVQAYGSPDFQDLSFTENDVDDLTAAMTQSGYSRENITVLTKNKAVPREILQKLRAISDKCSKDDVLFVGFAGHGFERPNPGNPDRRQQFFCGYGARRNQPDTLVDLDEVYRILGDSRAGMKLIVMDACRNPLDRSLPEAVPGHSTVTSGNIPQGVLAFFSSSSGQRSFESPSLKHGVFFHYLIEAFQGKAKTSNGQLDWTDLVAHLKNNVGPYVKSNLNQTQDWHFQGNVNNHLPLAEVNHSRSPNPNGETVVDMANLLGIDFKIQSVERNNNTVLFEIISINHKADRFVQLLPGFSYAIDESGDKQSIRRHDGLGEIPLFHYEVPVRLKFSIEFLPPNNTKIKLLVIRTASGDCKYQNIPISQAGARQADKQDAVQSSNQIGDLVLQTDKPIRNDVTAWVEVDGKRFADWKADTTEIKLVLPAGSHRVVVRSTYMKAQLIIFEKDIEIVSGKTITMSVGP
jgi:hypothetical protein